MSFTFRHNRFAVLTLGIFLAAVAHSFAQDVRVETQQQARTRSENALEESEAPASPSDPELGDINLVSRAPKPKMFTLATVQTLNYSSNAFLVRDGEQSDFFWNGRLGAAFVPYSTRNFTPTLSFTQDWFRYDDFSVLDFDAQTLVLDLKYDLNRDDTWFVDGSYALSRLSSPDTGEFYRYGFLNGSITHVLQLQTAPVTVWLTGGTYWRHGDPSPSDRISGYVSVSAAYNITEKVQASLFARPEWQHYMHDPLGSREDVNLTLGASVTWQPHQDVALVATGSYIGNWSSVGERKYNLLTPSLIFAAKIAF
jgi:hypothetical protein